MTNHPTPEALQKHYPAIAKIFEQILCVKESEAEYRKLIAPQSKPTGAI